MAKKQTNVAESTYKVRGYRPMRYTEIECIDMPETLRRRARFAPQLLADGLTSGIVSDQGNLVHSAFDEGTDVDPYVDIHSDKFQLMQNELTPAGAPSGGDDVPPPTDNQ